MAHVQAQSQNGAGRGEVGWTGGSGDLGKPSVDQSFWGKSTNMDLGYYSLCRWDGQNPCGFLCQEGANLRGTMKMEIDFIKRDEAPYHGRRRVIAGLVANLQNSVPALWRSKRSGWRRKKDNCQFPKDDFKGV